MTRTLALLVALAGLTGCSSLSKPDERRVYKEPPAALVEAPPADAAVAPAADTGAPELRQLQMPARPPGSG